MRVCGSRHAPRHGLTLVELTVALALSAMLMAGIVGLLRGLNQQSELAEEYDTDVWPARFVSLIRSDLMSAQSLWDGSGVIWMRHDASGQAQSRVGYRCRTLTEGLSVLERIDADAVSVLAIGPARVDVERLDAQGLPQPIPNTPGPVPTQVRIWVWDGENTEPVVLRDLVLR